ncbi:MAG: GDP-mannose 4,6-dehydratase, partial [Imperialibacter sp.]
VGNLDAKRDWGHAKDYVEAMWRILQQDVAEDYVIATGVTTSVRDFIKMSFAHVGLNLAFHGNGLNEVGVLESMDSDRLMKKVGNSDLPEGLKVGDTLVKVDPRYFRPTEVDLLIGDPAKANSKLGWTPKYQLKGLVEEMMDSDVKLFQRDIHLLNAGHKVLKQAE